jgi:hypothetical protein
MQLNSIFDRFVEESPLSVMVRGLADGVFICLRYIDCGNARRYPEEEPRQVIV